VRWGWDLVQASASGLNPRRIASIQRRCGSISAHILESRRLQLAAPTTTTRVSRCPITAHLPVCRCLPAVVAAMLRDVTSVSPDT
jgi:hypothetical protein